MIDIITIKWFYPMLFTAISVVLIVFICSVKAILIKFKDKDSQNFLFKTHVQEHMDITDKISQEHIDTTSKMKDMHDNVVHVQFGEEHEKEFDVIEKELKKLQDNVNELNEKVDLLIKRLVILETRK